MLPLREFVKKHHSFIVAHRGSSGNAPENTLAAYRLAIDDSSDMIEMDVQLTKDKVFIAYHDSIPMGLDKDISDINYSEIADLDIGAGFDSNFAGETIPTLETALELIKDKCYLILEIKTLAGKHFKENANNLLKLVDKIGYLDKAIFASFNYAALQQLKDINPSIHTAAIKIPMDNRLPSEIKDIIGCESYICSVEELNDTMYNDALQSEIILGVYSVDTKSQFLDAKKYNVSAFGTNFPATVRAWLNETS